MKVFDIKGIPLTLALFIEVSNSKELLAEALIQEVAFLNASLTPDVFPVLVAAHKTLLAKAHGSLKTRNLHSEIVHNYSGSKHISESLKRCGISNETTYLLMARFGAGDEQMKEAMSAVNGKEIDLEEMKDRADKNLIKKHYKITDEELGISSIVDAITSRIAVRDTY